VACLEKGELVIEGVNIDTKTEIVSKLAFSKDGDHWEATSSPEGDLVVAVDCTQDEAILSAGKSREFMNHVQQLRKGAGLDLKDEVEIFFCEDEGIKSTEDAVSRNVPLFEAKFKGAVPVPKQFASNWSVVIGSELVEVGGSKVEISICRPALATRDTLETDVSSYLSTVDPTSVTAGEVIKCTIDGTEHSLTEGKDFWISTASKMKSTKVVDWL
jgi:isoleucyl-tRNA synthetase